MRLRIYRWRVQLARMPVVRGLLSSCYLHKLTIDIFFSQSEYGMGWGSPQRKAPATPGSSSARKPGPKRKGDAILDVTFEDVIPLFHLSLTAAAKQLNMCNTMLKRLCRKHGVDRWPARRVKAEKARLQLKEEQEAQRSLSTPLRAPSQQFAAASETKATIVPTPANHEPLKRPLSFPMFKLEIPEFTASFLNSGTQ